MADKFLWWKHGIIYQIYPRSFLDTGLDGIGDLQGIRQKLDYLKDLGVDGLWLSPINPSPDKDFGYDVADYNGIDPKFGDMATFDLLLEEAHQRGIHIIMDLVLNHTSDQHPWFLESASSRDNPYHDWYIWRDPAPGGGFPNNWTSIFSGPAWKFNEARGQYFYHMFTPEQPDLNWRNPKVREAMLAVFKFWLDRGVDGFRLDVFNAYYKHPELADNPVKPSIHLRPFDRTEHINDVSQPEMIPLVRDIRSLLDQYPERYVVGETFLADSAQARTYIGEDRLHAGFDYGFTHAPFSAKGFGKAVQYWDALHGEEAWPNYFFNNHDTKRSATRFAAGEDDARLKVLLTLQLAVRGTPYLYYGEEIGMRDIPVKRSELQDPVGKTYWPLPVGRDGCRSPMQWNAETYAGFSKVQPWLPVHRNYPVRNVATQERDPQSLLHFYKELIKLRRVTPALHAGTMLLPEVENPALLLIERHYGAQQALVVLNFSRKQQVHLLPYPDNETWSMVFSGLGDVRPALKGNVLWIPPYGTVILTRETGEQPAD